ncbi:MAG: DUF3488 domain-containing protein [Pirellulaceae bacterium]|nr:DUF3488 domain-containing protein [Pirellulaceae bacterium]
MKSIETNRPTGTKVERLLQVSVATLTVASVLLFGMGQRDAGLPALVILAVLVSMLLTDATGWFCLNRHVAGIAAVGVFLLMAGQMFSRDPFQLILAIARMVVYLQVIVLFQRKDRRVYWQLIVLSLLLVVVATVFTQGVFFGLLMIAYLFMAISAMALVFLYHESNLYAAPDSVPPARPDPSIRRPWPFAGEVSHFSGDGRMMQSGEAGPMRELLGRLVRLGLGTLVFTAVAFLVLPRFGQSAWRGPFFKPRHLVGYAGKVELGQLGNVVEDSSEVLRIEFTDTDTQRMYPVNGAIYLHGTVLTRYADRVWSLPNIWRYFGTVPVRENIPRGDMVLQSVVIEPMDRNEVFAVQPCFTLQTHRRLRYDPYRQTLSRHEEERDDRYAFKLRTNAFEEGKQKAISPVGWEPNMDHLLEVSKDKLPTLVETAERWMAEPGSSVDRIIDRAQFLSNKLKYSDQFRYSLKKQPRDDSIDPIEDFCKNNPAGHCEYFASALTLMLRSQGIPARMVLGYKSDEFNPFGKYFQVRQLHAHTWVEVYLTPDQIPPGIANRGGEEEDWARGAWLRLDPTPGADAGEQGAVGQALAKAGKSIDWLEYLWGHYVMEMDRLRQQQAIYRPLVDWLKGTYERLTSLQWWKETALAMLRALDPRNWNLGQWLGWRGFFTLVLLGLAAWIARRLARLLTRRAGRWLQRRRRRAALAARARVPFYRRFQNWAAGQGWHRADGQTHREFARSVALRLTETREGDGLAELPETITDAFYQVRFGQHPLDKTRHEQVEQALDRLENTLDRHAAGRQPIKETIAP